MSVDVIWQIEKRMILVSVGGSMTIEDLGQMSLKIEALLNEGQAPVHIIFDLSKAQARPVKITEISQATKFLKHPSLGLHAMVSSSRLINFLGTVVHNMMGNHQAYVTESLDDAVSRLTRMDTSLTPATK